MAYYVFYRNNSLFSIKENKSKTLFDDYIHKLFRSIFYLSALYIILNNFYGNLYAPINSIQHIPSKQFGIMKKYQIASYSKVSNLSANFSQFYRCCATALATPSPSPAFPQLLYFWPEILLLFLYVFSKIKHFQCRPRANAKCY